MDYEQARSEYAAGRIKEALAEPATGENGWVLLFRDEHGTLTPLTDHAGHPRLFKDLDAAAELAHRVGFRLVNVEERF
jgi:hypothetical protein